jgi:hypothetical protein
MQPTRKTRSRRNSPVAGDIHEQLRQLYGPLDIPDTVQLRDLLERYGISLEGNSPARDDEEKQRNG